MSKSEEWNRQVEHPLQAYEWGAFREKTGVKVVRQGGMQVSIHKIPYTPWCIGYAPKIAKVNEEVIEDISRIAKDNKCIFIKIEPKIEAGDYPNGTEVLKKMGLVTGRPLFTKYNFVLDVTKGEEELLALMKQKTRYNIRVAQKKGVEVEIDNSEVAFEKYLELTRETSRRQGFYAHTDNYHRKMWETLREANIANLLVARYQGKIITTWIVFKFKDTLYYPYGASTREYREVMANNLVMWEAIRLAKKWGCKSLDMWGALGPNPDPNDSWSGFHNFKLGYSGRHVEYIGTWDYVENKLLYKLYLLIEKLRWKILRLITYVRR